MPTPYIIEKTLTNAATDAVRNSGPFFYNGDIFAICDDFVASSGGTSLGAFQANNPAGTSWTARDTAHEPQFYAAECWADPGGNAAYLAYVATFGGPLTIGKFDFTTLKFSVIATGGPTVSWGGIQFPIKIVRMPSGSFVITYTQFTAAPVNPSFCYLVEWSSGGGWGVPILVNNQNQNTVVVGAALDSTHSRAHFLRSDTLLGGHEKTVHFSYHAGAISADTLIENDNGVSSDLESGQGSYDLATDTVEFPVFFNITGTAPGLGSVKLSPSAAPAVSLSYVSGQPTYPFSSAGSPCLVVNSTSRYLLVEWYDSSVPRQQTLYSQWTGSAWGPALVYWDSSVDPPPTSFAPEVTTLSAFINPATGALATVVGTFDNTFGVCGLQLYMSVGGTPPPPSTRKFLPQYIKRPNNANA